MKTQNNQLGGTMDNDTYDDRTSRLRDEVCIKNNRTNIKFLKQQEFNANIVKRLEELEEFNANIVKRLEELEIQAVLQVYRRKSS